MLNREQGAAQFFFKSPFDTSQARHGVPPNIWSEQ